MQVEIFSLYYKGSLIEFESYSMNVELLFLTNHVENNKFIGSSTSLVAISGGIMKIYANTLLNNGYLSERSFSNHPDSLAASLNGNNFPYSQYLYSEAQAHGVFGFYFDVDQIQDG